MVASGPFISMPHSRWLALSVLLAAELLVGVNLLTVPDLSGQTGLVAMAIASAAQSFKVAVAFAATCLLVFSRRLGAITQTLGDQAGYRWWPWLAAHALACGVFLLVAWPVLGPAPDAALATAPWLLATLGLGAATLVFLLLAPEQAGADHLKALARISRLLRDPLTIEKLKASRDRATLHAVLTEPATSHAA